MPHFDIDLTDADHAAVAETVGDPQKWLRANIASLVEQCRSAARLKRAREVGIHCDLVERGLTEAEVEAIVSAREAKKRAAEEQTAAIGNVCS